MAHHLMDHDFADNPPAGIRERYRAAFDATGGAAAIIEEDSIISLSSTGFEQLSGYSRDEIEGKMSWTEFVSAGDMDRVEEYFRLCRSNAGSAPKSCRFDFVDRRGAVTDMLLTLSAVPGTRDSIVSFTDITEAGKIEERVRSAAEMGSAETLAEGVAEVFNNILTAIVGCGKLLQMKIGKGDPAIKYVEHILAASDKAVRLTQGLLAFSRKQIISPKPDDVNRMIRRVRGLLTRLLGEGRELRLALCDAELTVLAESGQLEQVLMNLTTNARDAMSGGGVLTIRTERVNTDNGRSRAHRRISAGDCALISVSDTGAGMDGATRERVFEPFFTTKEPGEFTGLGLSVVYGIVKQHGGCIDIKSEPGRGAVFEIYLPLVGDC